jgi:serine/threonine protein kinase
MTEVLKKFGRYFLLDQIAQGGMAEIYRARLASKEGAGRLLVIKRIQAGFGGNAEFLQMFKSEIKTTMGFNHSNIAQLYDFGEEGEQPYIAMELVDGKNLRQFLTRFAELKQNFPIELAAHIIEQSASGLHYAHTFKDKITGEPLNVVHRDISPQNIIIAYEGNVKVIDFGIAKARTNSEHTRAGVIKGKPSYLSPEQISGDHLDGRTDLFALGAVFWELLTGKKLFQGDNDLAVLKLIESCTTSIRPPSELNPNVPKELDAIVMKMLQKNPDKRYQTGDELARAIRRFMVSYSPEFSPSDISHVAKEIFNREIVEDRKKIQRLNDRVEQLMVTEIPVINTMMDQAPSVAHEDTTTHIAKHKSASKPADFKMEKEAVAQKFTVEPVRHTPPPAPSKTRTSMSQSTQGSRQTQFSKYAYVHTDAEKKSGGFGFLKWGTAVASIIGVSLAGPQFFGFSVPILSDLLGAKLPISEERVVNESPTEDPASAQASFEVKNTRPVSLTAVLKLNVFPQGVEGKISVNGKVLDAANPVIEVSTDAPLELAIERPGFQPFKSEFVVSSKTLDANNIFTKEVTLEPVQNRMPARTAEVDNENYGYLTVLSTPSAEVTIFVDGKPWSKKYAPFERLKVPTGKFELRFYNATLDLEDKMQFQIEKAQAKRVQSSLKPKR